MGVFYAAVDGDPLTSHPDSYVIARPGIHSASVVGRDGKTRSLVYIGDSAWCGACRSVGRIVGGSGISEQRRMIDLAGSGRRQAVGEDQVICKCPTLPRIIPVHGKRWKVVDADVAAPLPVMSAPYVHKPVVFDEQFTLIDAYGIPMAGVYYTVKLPSGEVRHGIADALGQTLRFQTQDAQYITVYLGHQDGL